MYYTKEEREEKTVFKGKTFVFEYCKDLSTGITIYSREKFVNDPDVLAKEMILFTSYWMINHYPMLDSFPGFNTIKVTVIPF